MKAYGYPTITLKDKETGKIKKEISCKNIQTIPAKMMFSNIGYINETYTLMIRKSSSSNPISFIYTMPYRMPKTPYYYMDNRDEEGWRRDNYIFPDGQASRSVTDVTGIENFRYDKDSDGRTVIVFKGVLYAPDSGVRKIGTIALNISTDGTEFYTPLDEIIVQDSATVVDITYKIIVSGESEREYITNLSGVLSYSYSGDGRGSGTISYPLNYSKSIGGMGVDSTTWDIDDDKVIFGLSDTNMKSSQYNSLIMRAFSGSDRNATINRYGHKNIMSPVKISTVSYEDMKKSGSIIGCVGASRRSISPESIRKISNGKGVSATFSKTRANINSSIKPFFEASSIKKGTGSIKAISATEKYGLPERWEIDVLKGGSLSDSEFRVRKTIVSGYYGNSNVQTFAPIPHLSYPGNINGMVYKKYNHPDGMYYESSPAIWPLYGQNIAIVIRKGVLLTSVGNSRYIVLDETNLPHENRGIQITGIAWDDRQKGLLIGCGESGLYKVEFDNDTDETPVVKRVTKDGIERVYAISGNGKGGVAIITDSGIMYSENLGETWNTKPFSTVKKQLMGVSPGFDAAFDYENKLKYSNMGFVLSRDGNSVGICLLAHYYNSGIPFIELKTEKKGSGTPYSSDRDYYQSYPIGSENSSGVSLVPICIGPQKAEAEKTTVRDMVNSEKYSLQPGAAWGIAIDGRPVMVGYEAINIAYGDIKKYEYSYNMSAPTSNEYSETMRAIIDSKGNPIVNGRGEYPNSISNGRWSLDVRRSGFGKTYTLVSGPNIGISKDNPDIFDYYSSESGSFTKVKESKFKTPSSNFEIDGVKFSASGDNFVAGDCFVFHRTYAYVNDNVSTASFTIEESCLPVSNEFEQSGTISEGNNKPKYRHPICTKTNMYLTRDGRLKTKDKTHTLLGYIHKAYPQYILPGSSKMKFDLSTLKGTFLISIKTSSNSGDYFNYKNIFVSNIGSGISYHCNTKRPNYLDDFLLPTNTLLQNPGNFAITIDSEKMGATVNDGDRVIWTSGSDSAGSYQMSYVTIVPVTTSKVSGTIKVGFTQSSPSSLNGDEVNTDPEMKLPTFEYAYRGALCTRLGNEGSRSGTFDPVFYGLPFIGSPDMINIEIDGRSAEVVYTNYLDLESKFFVKSEKPNRGGVSANISAGQVKIEPYTGLVFFSDEDIGKPYRIRYKYYKGDSLGIGEEIIE